MYYLTHSVHLTKDWACVGKKHVLHFAQDVLASLLPRLVASILAHTLRPNDSPANPGEHKYTREPAFLMSTASAAP